MDNEERRKLIGKLERQSGIASIRKLQRTLSAADSLKTFQTPAMKAMMESADLSANIKNSFAGNALIDRQLLEVARMGTLVDDMMRERALAISRFSEPLQLSIAQSTKYMQAFGEIGYTAQVKELSEFANDINGLRGSLPDLAKSLALPRNETLKGLLSLSMESPVKKMMESYGTQMSTLKRAMEAARAPWLATDSLAISFVGFARIQGLSKLVNQGDPYDIEISNRLRDDLGDWRNVGALEVIADPQEEDKEKYDKLGFDHSLLEMPRPTLKVGLEVSGLRRSPPSVLIEYMDVFEVEDVEVELSLIRTNEAHNWLQRLESRLRQCIDILMTQEFGVAWPKSRLPNNMYPRWLEKREQAMAAGRPEYPLIYYADFTDYIDIICRKDNWHLVFEAHFKRKEDIRESLARLLPIRIDTMHARQIDDEDALLLVCETRRIIRVIRNVIVRRT